MAGQLDCILLNWGFTGRALLSTLAPVLASPPPPEIRVMRPGPLAGPLSLAARPLAQLRNAKLLPAVVITQEVVMTRAFKEQPRKENRAWRLCRSRGDARLPAWAARARLTRADRSSNSGIWPERRAGRVASPAAAIAAGCQPLSVRYKKPRLAQRPQ